MLVVGSERSSNAKRLVEVSERHGAPAELIPSSTALDLKRMRDIHTIGVTGAASTPDALVRDVVDVLVEDAAADVETVTVATEEISFVPPTELR